MPRAATTSDVFNAVAEPRRREIIDVLAGSSPRTVGQIVSRLRLPQPAVSKHLAVLRQVGLVTVRKDGQQRHYSLQPRELKVVHDWVKSYERFWTEHLDHIKEAAERKARELARKANPTKPTSSSNQPFSKESESC